MIRTLLFACLSLITAQLPGQELIRSEFLSHTPASDIIDLPGISTDYDVDAYRLIYRTDDVDGDSTLASGLLVLPVNGACNVFPLMVYCHGTVLRKNNVPSRENAEAELVRFFSSAGSIGLAPDYLGYADSPGLHPYHHSDTEASATIDLLQAARQFLQTATVSDNGEVFISGYSQGGHAAMATLKYAHEHDLIETLGIVAGAPCSGAYDLSTTQVNPILEQGQTYEYMGYLAFMIMAYERVYGNIFNETEEVFEQEFVAQIEGFFDGMQDQYPMSQVHAVLPNTLDQLLVDSVLAQYQIESDHPLRQALRSNDNYDWRPDIPMRLFYCSGDEQVNPQNSMKAEMTMLNKGAEDVQAINSFPGADHGDCAIPALLDAFQFFSSLASPCQTTAVSGVSEIDHPDVYPNPASTEIHMVNLQSVHYIRFFNSRGMDLSNPYFPDGRSSARISLQGVPPGMYFLQFYGKNGLIGGKKIIVQ